MIRYATAMAFISTTLTAAPNLVTGKLSRGVERYQDSSKVYFNCKLPAGIVYKVALDESSRLMTVGFPDGTVMEGFTARTTDPTDDFRHYYFTNGFVKFSYHFMLSVPTSAAQAKFELTYGATQLVCNES